MHQSSWSSVLHGKFTYSVIVVDNRIYAIIWRAHALVLQNTIYHYVLRIFFPWGLKILWNVVFVDKQTVWGTCCNRLVVFITEEENSFCAVVIIVGKTCSKPGLYLGLFVASFDDDDDDDYETLRLLSSASFLERSPHFWMLGTCENWAILSGAAV